MDFLRLPSALRRSILLLQPQILRRLLSTTTTPHDAFSDPPQPPPKEPSPPKDTQQPPPNQQPLLPLTPSNLNTYTTLPPPTPLQLRQSNAFFQRHDPLLLYTSPRFLSLPPSPYPEIAVLGRSNVGKSSLLNALFGRPRLNLARTSKKPGKTRTINGFGIGGESSPTTSNNQDNEIWRAFGRGGVVVVDMPGYGSGSREDWGTEIMKYIENRKQLRRTYVLVDSEHGLKKTDLELLMYFRRKGVQYLVVLSKVDKVLFPKAKGPSALSLSNSLRKLRDVKMEVQDTLNREASQMGMRGDVIEDILCCSGNPDKAMKGEGDRKRMLGVDELRWNILTACGMEGSGRLELGRVTKLKMKAEEDRKGRESKAHLLGAGDDDDGGSDWDDD